MDRSLLAQLPVFLAVAEKKSFTRAGLELGISASAVSQSIQRLEKEMGAPLLVRTTRSVNLTELGKRLAADAKPAVERMAAALGSVQNDDRAPSGVLRLNVPRLACHVVLPPILGAFARKHPRVHVDVTVDNRNVDIVADGFDAGIRLREAVEKDMVAVRLSPAMRFVVVAAKRYLTNHPRPQHPRALVEHACLGWRSPTSGTLWRWEFKDGKRPIEVAVNGPLSSSDPDLLLRAARDGLGLTYVAEHEARSDLAAGRLVSVLDEFCPEVYGLFLYYPRAARQVPKLAAFVECARQVSA
jgi:DNA-binding transcriptional LysR family regulator